MARRKSAGERPVDEAIEKGREGGREGGKEESYAAPVIYNEFVSELKKTVVAILYI